MRAWAAVAALSGIGIALIAYLSEPIKAFNISPRLGRFVISSEHPSIRNHDSKDQPIFELRVIRLSEIQFGPENIVGDICDFLFGGEDWSTHKTVASLFFQRRKQLPPWIATRDFCFFDTSREFSFVGNTVTKNCSARMLIWDGPFLGQRKAENWCACLDAPNEDVGTLDYVDSFGSRLRCVSGVFRRSRSLAGYDPQPNCGDAKNDRENSGDRGRDRANPNWPIYPPVFMFIGVFGGMAIFGGGFAVAIYRRNWIFGALLALCGITLLLYALFCPLIVGAYVWPLG